MLSDFTVVQMESISNGHSSTTIHIDSTINSNNTNLHKYVYNDITNHDANAHHDIHPTGAETILTLVADVRGDGIYLQCKPKHIWICFSCAAAFADLLWRCAPN